MKNIYEMTTKERDGYRDEFNKLEYAKKLNKNRFISLMLVFLFALAAGILDGLKDEGYKFLSDYSEMSLFIAFISFVTFLFYEINSRISFARWLKLKHNVEY